MAVLYSLVLIYLMHQGLTEAVYYCYPTGTFTIGSSYQTNRDAFLYDMSEDISVSGYQHYGPPPQSSAIVFCLALCRLDITSNTDACSSCIKQSVSLVSSRCKFYKELIAWGDDAGCLIRCSPHKFPQTIEANPTTPACSSTNLSQNVLPEFDHVLANLTRSIANRAALNGAMSSFSSASNSPKYFASEESKVGDQLTIYALGFCIPTLFQTACTACLLAAANHSVQHCKLKQGATFFSPSCVLRYETYRFYSSVASSPTVSPPPYANHASSHSNGGRKGSKSGRTIATILSVIAGLSLFSFIVIIIIAVKKRKKKEADHDEMEFSLKTIRTATDNFSTNNKLGQGGYGVVYMGRLPNGQQIAVKRLTLQSSGADVEFKNEVRLVARLHHKNLIRLLGYCVQGGERILVYELALNGSLDRLIFDPTKRQQLTWDVRYNIIEGITRGILYLHDESQLKIIHRDLKPSNILLDEYMTPKLSDFGTARLFIDDQSSASKIVGTFGYMSPEYVKHAKVSTKVDVFSFGVLLLEIICGKRNNAARDLKHFDHLLSKAWKCWTTGELDKLIDPILLRSSDQTSEMTRCLHIGLLCVQLNAAQRPDMSSVILMLEGHSGSFPPPSKPAYYVDIEEVELSAQNMGQDQPSNSSSQQMSLPSNGLSSIADVSITHYLEPR